MADNIKRQASYPACGRLIVLQSLQGRDLRGFLGADENFDGFTAINFPAMPDAIDLVRRAEYQVSSPIGFPDGMHFYKGTAPLEIPFSFKLHAQDSEYCPLGAKTVLQVAASLEALVLPFGPDGATQHYNTELENGNEISNAQGDVMARSKEPSVTKYDTPENIFPPATCYLELILTERDSVGIACVGYIKEVRVRLLGPFLKGPGISQNLPIAGEFEFIFVQHPGHGNAYRANRTNRFTEQQAFANVVKDRLFNTVSLMTRPDDFKSFND